MAINRTAPRKALAAIAVSVLLLVGCAAMGGSAPPEGVTTGAEPAAEEAGGGHAADVDAAAGDESGATAPLADLALNVERRIVKVGDMTIEVGDVGAALGTARALAIELGGYVGATQAGDAESGATLTLRIPAESFDLALERLRDLDGEVLSETTREEDVTSAIVDLEARIENLRASEVTYRSLLERANQIEDILAVQSRLDEVRGQIEQLEAQAQSLAGQADLSTLTVRFVPVPVPVEQTTEGWNPGDTVGQAVAALLSVGQGLLTAAIWIGIVLVPLALGIAAVAFVVIRVGAPLRRRALSEPRAEPMR